MKEPHYNHKKLLELVLYVASQSEEMELFGMTKLNKILFYSDFYTYANLGAPVTGAQYKKFAQGPLATQVPPLRDRLVKSGEAAVQKTTFKIGTRERLLALRDPNLKLFTTEEISTVDRVIRKLWNMSAAAVSDLSHEMPGWRLTELEHVIPYHTALIPADPVPLSDEDHKFLRAVAQRRAAE